MALGSARTRTEALQVVAEAAGRAVRAEVVVVRVADVDSGRLNARAVATSSPAVAAELEGSWLPLSELPLPREPTRSSRRKECWAWRGECARPTSSSSLCTSTVESAEVWS